MFSKTIIVSFLAAVNAAPCSEAEKAGMTKIATACDCSDSITACAVDKYCGASACQDKPVACTDAQATTVLAANTSCICATETECAAGNKCLTDKASTKLCISDLPTAVCKAGEVDADCQCPTEDGATAGDDVTKVYVCLKGQTCTIGATPKCEAKANSATAVGFFAATLATAMVSL